MTMPTYGPISKESKIVLVKAITNAEPIKILKPAAIAPNIKSKNIEIIAITTPVNMRIPMNLPI